MCVSNVYMKYSNIFNSVFPIRYSSIRSELFHEDKFNQFGSSKTLCIE